MKRQVLNSKIVSLLLVLWAGCGIVWGQTYTISGTIKDKSNNKPILGATVQVGEEAGANSDEAGKFTFTVEGNGRSEIPLKSEMQDYATYETTIPLGSNTNITWDIQLLPTTFTEKDVVITASKGMQQEQKDVTVSIAVVKQRAINLQATPNVEKVITQIPGVDNLDGQLNIRGSSGYAYGVGSRVMVLLDGLPLLTGDAAYPELSMIPVDNISQVEVMKGASSVMYGSAALGGVINVITGDASDKPRTSIRFRSGIYGKPYNDSLDWDGNKSAYNASLHVFHQRKIKNLSITAQADLIKDSGYRLGTDKEEVRGILHLKYQPKKVPGLTIGLNTTFRRDSSGSTIFYDRYFPTVVNKWNGTDSVPTLTGGGLTPSTSAGVYRKQLNSRIALDPVVKYLTKKGDLFWYRGRFLKNTNINDSGQGSDSYVTYNDFLYQTTVFKKVNWVTGFTATYGYTNSPELYNGSYSQLFTGVYSQADAKFGKWNLSLGGRLESVKTNVLTIANPVDSLKDIRARNERIIEQRATRPVMRAGLNYEIAKATNVRASFGQAFRVPSIAEYFAAVAAGGVNVTPNLDKKDSADVVRPENGWSAEIALRQGYAFGSSLTRKFMGYLDVAGFTMRYNDMMEFGLNRLKIAQGPNGQLAPQAFFSTRNVSDARITGVEVTTINSYTTKNFQFNFSGGLTYIIPINLNAVPDSNQLNISYFNSAQPINTLAALNNAIRMEKDVNNPNLVDAPRELKYRNRTLVRASAGVSYKGFGVSTNYRYRSFTKSIDQYLHLVIGDLNYFRTKHPNGEHVFDLIFSYDIKESQTLSLTIDNLFNTEYFIIPGSIAEQRKFTLQYQVRF